MLVACTQPRVITTTSVAQRMAQELNVGLGDEVGYAVRFDNTSNDRTRLKFQMDGFLLQELRSDREPSRYVSWNRAIEERLLTITGLRDSRRGP